MATARAQPVAIVYVAEKQEERRSTQFTLTEWLRIKERMKLMDVWLAMFSTPEKDRFSPELRVSANILQGQFHRTDSLKSSAKGQDQTAQIFLTNLISGTIGLKSLNIDLGATYKTQNLTSSSTSGDLASFQLNQTRDIVAGNLRILGDHIQDTSLVLSYGSFHSSGLQIGLTESAPNSLQGSYLSAALEVYITSGLGLTGSMSKMEADTAESSLESVNVELSTLHYGAFVAISLLRIQYEIVEEKSLHWQNSTPINTQFKGHSLGLSLMF